MTYGYEDTDYKTKGDESTGYAFNAATSTFFCRIRDLFADELSDMFVDRESAGAWSAEGLINQFDEFQSEFPEELWRLDIERKYLRPYRDGNTRFLNQMANGRKKYQRRQFERNQEKYMASKFFGNVAVSDQIMFRCNTPTDANISVKPNYTLYLTPYSDMYLDVLFGATYRTQVRAEAGKQYTITCPFTTMDDTAVLVYCSSLIQSMGDLSACYIHDNDFSKASKLKELIIGNATEGYQNSFLTNLGIGNNTLLEKLDIQNTPNLVQALNLANCNNLKELYAYGSGLTGATFADGGMIEIAQLPAVTALTMKNLIYLTDFNVSSFDNLTTLVAENCSTVNIQNILNQATSINRVRITGIDWSLDDTTLLEKIYIMTGIDKSGYNIPQSVLSGRVHVPVIKQKQLENYQSVWPDLEISYNTLVAQYTVTFINQDNTVLDIQYVDKGAKPVDPITRSENPIATPTLASTVSTDYTFAGWDSTFVDTFVDTVIYATYTESIRQYTVRYVSNGSVLQETVANYGTIVLYEGDLPTYTAEESAYKYYLFDGWDKSGYVNGDKTINAVYDSCEYNAGYFDGKDISIMRPVEIYAMTQLGLESQYVESKDTVSITLGNDVSYEDIEEKVFISEETIFDGTNYIDTGEQLFSEDRDFVLAIDYAMTSTTTNSVLAQCYSDNGMDGFRLWYNSGIKLSLGSSSMTPSSNGNREMLVIRHIKGETGLHVYASNTSSTSTNYVELSGVRSPIHNSTLVFGCSKADDGAYENYATGTIYWSKVWYADLGDNICSYIAYWPHEIINFEMCGFKRYYLSNNASKRSSMSFLATAPLSRSIALNTAGTTTGGWGAWSLNEYLNSRIYNAFPEKWKQLMKQVKVKSSIGNKSTEVATADCYITIPAAIEMDSTKNTDPYISEGSVIDYFTTAASRILYDKNGNAVIYWLRSPNKDYDNYVFTVRAGGDLYGYNVPTSLNYVRIMFSI